MVIALVTALGLLASSLALGHASRLVGSSTWADVSKSLVLARRRDFLGLGGACALLVATADSDPAVFLAVLGICLIMVAGLAKTLRVMSRLRSEAAVHNWPVALPVGY